VRKILVADDEHNIRHILDFSLAAEGFQVLAASSGDEVVALAALELPDLIILDIMMPGGDGLEACRRLKADERTSQIPVILLTARNQPVDREAGRSAGADDYVTKPFSPQRLIDKVLSLLHVAKR
jgi:DNA-binding response OmpR family regulator